MSAPVLREYLVGEVYFSIRYVGKAPHFPIIDSFVFVGFNVLGDENKPTWYFQDAESYAQHGSFLSGAHDDMFRLMVTEEQINQYVRHDELRPELDEAFEERRRQR